MIFEEILQIDAGQDEFQQELDVPNSSIVKGKHNFLSIYLQLVFLI